MGVSLAVFIFRWRNWSSERSSSFVHWVAVAYLQTSRSFPRCARYISPQDTGYYSHELAPSDIKSIYWASTMTNKNWMRISSSPQGDYRRGGTAKWTLTTCLFCSLPTYNPLFLSLQESSVFPLICSPSLAAKFPVPSPRTSWPAISAMRSCWFPCSSSGCSCIPSFEWQLSLLSCSRATQPHWGKVRKADWCPCKFSPNLTPCCCCSGIFLCILRGLSVEFSFHSFLRPPRSSAPRPHLAPRGQ